METRRKSRTVVRNLMLLLIPWAIFVLSFRYRLAYPNTITLVLHLIPVVPAALMWGWKAGIITAIALIPANLCMRFLLDPGTVQEMLDPERVASWIILIAVGAILGAHRSKILFSNRAIVELEEANARLSKALSEIKELSGLLPICASCKSIRDDEGYWKKVEVFLTAHADVRFSHSICPDCEQKLYKLETQEV